MITVSVSNLTRCCFQRKQVEQGFPTLLQTSPERKPTKMRPLTTGITFLCTGKSHLTVCANPNAGLLPASIGEGSQRCICAETLQKGTVSPFWVSILNGRPRFCATHWPRAVRMNSISSSVSTGSSRLMEPDLRAAESPQAFTMPHALRPMRPLG